MDPETTTSTPPAPRLARLGIEYNLDDHTYSMKGEPGEPHLLLALARILVDELECLFRASVVKRELEKAPAIILPTRRPS